MALNALQITRLGSVRSVLRNSSSLLSLSTSRVRSVHTETLFTSFTSFSSRQDKNQNVETYTQIRSLSRSHVLQAKKEKKDKKKNASASSSSASSSPASQEDIFDFSELAATNDKIAADLKEELAKFRSGGRFNVESIETLRVSLSTTPATGTGGAGAKGKAAPSSGKESVQLNDIAQVITKSGRLVMVLVSEESYLKPVSSAISASQLSLNPQPDPHNPLQLNVPIPPPTKESREKALKDAKLAMEKALNAVRNARAAVNKKIKAQSKTVRPDDMRAALDQMEKQTAKGNKTVTDVYEAAKKTLES
ncbi:hypothetical protein FQN57_005781 [Myotisia sp. PD_48]|nr:hypothetical protein FQN57_005781 [Myotisia sp. PD_48]